LPNAGEEFYHPQCANILLKGVVVKATEQQLRDVGCMLDPAQVDIAQRRRWIFRISEVQLVHALTGHRKVVDVEAYLNLSVERVDEEMKEVLKDGILVFNDYDFLDNDEGYQYDDADYFNDYVMNPYDFYEDYYYDYKLDDDFHQGNLSISMHDSDVIGVNPYDNHDQQIDSPADDDISWILIMS